MQQKRIAILLSAFLVFTAVSACGEAQQSAVQPTSAPVQTIECVATTAPSPAPTSQPTPEPTPAPTPEPTATPVPAVVLSDQAFIVAVPERECRVSLLCETYKQLEAPLSVEARL